MPRMPENKGKDTQVDFGSFSGTRIKNIPTHYLLFITRNFKDTIWHTSWKDIALAELKRRGIEQKKIDFSSRSINSFSILLGLQVTRLKIKYNEYQPLLAYFGATGGIVDFMTYIFDEAISNGMIYPAPDTDNMFIVAHNSIAWKYVMCHNSNKTENKTEYDVCFVLPIGNFAKKAKKEIEKFKEKKNVEPRNPD